MPIRLQDLASTIVAVVEPETSALVAAQLMRRHLMDAVDRMRSNGLRRLVMVDDEGRLIGIATMEDLLEVLTQELSALTGALRGARDREFAQRR